MDLRQEILDGFQAASLLLVFVVMLFTVRYPTIISALNRELPNRAKPAERQSVRQEYRSILVIQCLPLLVTSGIVTYLMVLLAARTVVASDFRLWTSGFLEQGYVLVTAWNAVFFVWAVVLSVQVIRIVWRLRG
jgi:hypothetical protein